MEEHLKIYRTMDFIKKSPSGTIDLPRSLSTVRDLAAATDFHRDNNIFLDMRETVLDTSPAEVMRVAAEFAICRNAFRNKIAVLIPDNAERIARAAFMKACMDVEGFQWAFFTAYEDAIDWLAEITEIPLDES